MVKNTKKIKSKKIAGILVIIFIFNLPYSLILIPIAIIAVKLWFIKKTKIYDFFWYTWYIEKISKNFNKHKYSSNNYENKPKNKYYENKEIEEKSNEKKVWKNYYDEEIINETFEDLVAKAEHKKQILEKKNYSKENKKIKKSYSKNKNTYEFNWWKSIWDDYESVVKK